MNEIEVVVPEDKERPFVLCQPKAKQMFSRIKVPLSVIGNVYKWYFAFVLIMISLGGCSDSITTSLNAPSFVSPAVAYQPRGFLPGSESHVPSRQQIIEDLRVLRKNGFRSLVTYGSSRMLGLIPEIARREGFDGMVIMGIWDIFSNQEWNNALAQAAFVDGYCLGNEGLGVRYSPAELAFKMTKLRHLTHHPVTTSEPIANYLEGPYRDWLLSHSDWLFPIAHPFWDHQSDPNRAVNWIVARHDYLTATTGRRVIFKEAGLPTAYSVGLTEEIQLTFFQALESTGISFFYFEAFDQPWKGADLKQQAIEAHWGLHRTDGTPKKVIQWLAKRSSKQQE